jgi:hypothetical protein
MIAKYVCYSVCMWFRTAAAYLSDWLQKNEKKVYYKFIDCFFCFKREK